MSRRKRPAAPTRPADLRPVRARSAAAAQQPAGPARPPSQRGRHRRAFRHAHGLRPGRRVPPATTERPAARPTSAASGPIPATWSHRRLADRSAASPRSPWNRPASTGSRCSSCSESRGFEVWLVEPGQLSRCGARPKTDVLDAQWIQRLHSYGLLRPSFRPARFDPGPARLPPPAADADPLRRQPRPAHAEGAGADERQADRGACPTSWA